MHFKNLVVDVAEWGTFLFNLQYFVILGFFNNNILCTQDGL